MTTGASMAARHTPVDPGARESYWGATQAELKSARRHGDLLILAGVGLLLAALITVRGITDELRIWLIVEGLVFAVIVAGVWFVTRRKRRIAVARGLVCCSCSYRPHDTEIEDVAADRRCPRCAAEL